MSHKEFHLDKALNFPGAGKLLAEKGINALNEELKRRGETAKQKTESDAPAGKDAPEQKDWTPLVSELLNAVDSQQAEIDALQSAAEAQTKARKDADDATEKRVKALEDSKSALEKQVKDLQDAVKAIKEDTPRRASEAKETKLTEDEEKKAKEAIEKRTMEYDPMYPGMQVPLKQAQQS